MIDTVNPPLRIAWLISLTPCCGAEDILFVYPADAYEIECDLCDTWLRVPRYYLRRRGTELLLISEN